MLRPVLFSLTICLVILFSAFTITADDTRQQTFNPDFRSLQVCREDAPYSPPVIMLGSNDRILIKFDELAEDRRFMRYSITHCNANWQPSRISEIEYLDGFNIGDITDYAFSQATTVHYVNYRLTIPNEQIRPLLSGNYLLKIFDENDPDQTLLQARFMVCEPASSLDVECTPRTDVDYNDRHQQLSVTANLEQSGVKDLFNDLYLVIEQNGRQDNRHNIEKPLRINGNRAIYEHLPGLIFPAGNEYRRMEIVSTTYPGMGVERIDYIHPYYNMTLATDAHRAGSQYLYDRTQHGHFTPYEYNSSNPDTEADYVVTHFALKIPQQPSAEIHIDGEMTNRLIGSASRMNYDSELGIYTKAMLLKQGAYNYQYLFFKNGTTAGLTAPIEGDYYPTSNEYLLLLYHRPPLARYDRLIGTALFYTMP